MESAIKCFMDFVGADASFKNKVYVYFLETCVQDVGATPCCNAHLGLGDAHVFEFHQIDGFCLNIQIG